ncbi:MAG: hypothetical protein AB8B63_11265 [Granulosicoccus sp.]
MRLTNSPEHQKPGLQKKTVVVSVLLAVFMHVAQAESVYKYEERGMVIYQDRAPTSRQDDGHSILNHQGVVMKKIPSRQERIKARDLARQKQKAFAYDRALLATFTTEEDLIRTRDERIGMIDGLISRLDDRIRILSERLAIVDKRIELQESTAGAGGAQDALYDENERIEESIKNSWKLVDAKTIERHETSEKFTSDLRRYRELKDWKR